MIKSFKSKALAELWLKGRSGRIDAKLQRRIVRRLTALENAEALEDMNVPGFQLHALHRFNPTWYTVHVNGPWRVTFEFADGHAYRIDLEQYH